MKIRKEGSKTVLSMDQDEWRQIGIDSGWLPNQEDTTNQAPIDQKPIEDLSLFTNKNVLGRKFIVLKTLYFDGNTWYPENKPRSEIEVIPPGAILDVDKKYINNEKWGEPDAAGVWIYYKDGKKDPAEFDLDNLNNLDERGFIKGV